MTRRQRQGRGGRDHNGCGIARCVCCNTGRAMHGPTRQELLADEPVADHAAPDRGVDGDNGRFPDGTCEGCSSTMHGLYDCPEWADSGY